MSRTVKTKDVQEAIAILHAWSRDDCPDWARGVVQHLAMLIEDILSLRDVTLTEETP